MAFAGFSLSLSINVNLHHW